MDNIQNNVDVATQNPQEEVNQEVNQEVVQQEDRSEEKSFSQADVNNIVAKESKKATEKLLKELGIDDFENAKDGLKKFREYQESQKTEAEKNADKLKSLESTNSEISRENERLNATISALKNGVNAESVDDVILLAQKEITEDVTIDEAIKKVLDKYPLFAEKKEETKKKPSFTNGNNHINSDKTDIWSNIKDKYK